MKKPLFVFALLFFALTSRAIAQVTTKIQADSVRISQVGNRGAELIIENNTRTLTGGVLKNRGNGRTYFGYAVDTVFIDGPFIRFQRGPETISIPVLTQIPGLAQVLEVDNDVPGYFNIITQHGQMEDDGGRFGFSHDSEIELRANHDPSTDGQALNVNSVAGLRFYSNGVQRFRIDTMGKIQMSVANTKAVTGSTGLSAGNILAIAGGSGGNTSNSGSVATAGAGGGIDIALGTGGNTTGSPTLGFGGAGGTFKVLAGDGGNGSAYGGNGGDVSIQSGAGGQGSSFGGLPGSVEIKGGNAHVASNINGSDVFIHGGIGAGTGHDGTVRLGISRSLTKRGNVAIGSSDVDPRNLLNVGLEKNLSDTGIAIYATTAGTQYNTSSKSLMNIAGSFISNATRAAGTNPLKNVALYAAAYGGQEDYAAILEGTTRIHGQILSDGTAAGATINNTNNTFSPLAFQSNGTQMMQIGSAGSSASAFTNSNYILSNGYPVVFANGTSEQWRWDAANGRIGIGTSSPSANLHVVGKTYLKGGLDVGDTPYYDNQVEMSIKTNKNWPFNMYNQYAQFLMGLHQSGTLALGNDNVNFSTSALLDMKSTTQGFLPPRMTEVQRDGIISPAAGLMVFVTDNNKISVYAGSSLGWKYINYE